MSQGQRNMLLGGVALVAIAVAVTLFARNRGGTAAVAKIYESGGICLACKTETHIKQAIDVVPPYACSGCKKVAVYPWFYCESCKKRFIPDLVRTESNGPLRLPGFPSCPCRNCRSTFVGQYIPELIGKPAGGDAPLPEWKE